MDTNIFDSPIVWIVGIIVSLFPMGQIFRMATEGDLDMSTAMVIVCGFLVFGGISVAIFGPAGAGVLLAAMLIAGTVMPWAGKKYSKKLHEQIDDEKIEKYRAALERDSRNSGAHALLAQAYAEKKHYVEAVAHYEAALTLSPDPERNPHFEKWTRRFNAARVEKETWEAKQRTRT